MKSRILIIIVFVVSMMSIPSVFASENIFYGTSSFERLPSLLVPDNLQIIEIKFQYQDGPYSLNNLKPIIDVSPKGAASFVHIEFEPIEGIYRNSVARISGTITVDSSIPREKIFLNVSYAGTDSNDVSFKSGWNDSAIINIRENLSGAVLDEIIYPILSPLKQFKSGIQYDKIQCKEGFELVAKMPSAHPACVKPESVEKLTVRGWATTNKTLELVNPIQHTIVKNNTLFEIQYSLNGATLESIAHDANTNSIHVTLGNSIGGQIVISIPRILLDAKMGHNIDDVFFLLIDGEENMYGEKTTDDARIITVWFPKGAHDIEIIGTYWI